MALPDNDRARLGEKAGSNVKDTNTDILADVERFTRRVILDALNDATRIWWLKRAEDFERAKPRPGDDFNGAATIEELRARWQWCHDTAQACRNKAVLVPLDAATFQAELESVLDEAAAAGGAE
ncbi:hypothetical protein [Nocardioides lijunqiniae]|uniref:hypothetical protein n=1 Tax=Nocardioides lijunqiniae TaxID=2760832 RepID=UPI001877C12E|nr:hypothetical protein [Nocardioides lijunqiniae]